MSKRFLKVSGLISLLLFIVFIAFVIFANQAADSIKDKMNNAERLWNNYYEITNKINSREITSLITNSQLINNLNGINSSKNSDYSIYFQNLKNLATSKLSSEVDLIAVYSYNGNLITAASNSLNNVTRLNLSQVISRSLIGENLSLNIGINKE